VDVPCPPKSTAPRESGFSNKVWSYFQRNRRCKIDREFNVG
jgi:hypothetical protein